MEHPDPNDWPYQHPPFNAGESHSIDTPTPPPSTRPHPDNFEFHLHHDAVGFRALKVVVFSIAGAANVFVSFAAGTAVFSALGRELIPGYICAAFTLYWSLWYYWGEFKLWDGFSSKYDLIHQAVRTPARVFIWTLGFSVAAFPLMAITADGTVVGHLLPSAIGAVAGTALLGFFRAVYYERYIANLPVDSTVPERERLERLAHLEARRRRTGTGL